jgi:hypothetical protein
VVPQKVGKVVLVTLLARHPTIEESNAMANLREPSSPSTVASKLEALRSTFATLWAVYEAEPDCNPPTGDPYIWTA